MTKNQVRTRVGVFIVCSHFLCLAVVFLGIIVFSAAFEDALETAAVIAPIFFGYTAAIFKYRIRHSAKEVDQSEAVTWDYVFFVFLVPSVLALAIIGLYVVSHLPNRPITIQNGRIGIGAAEAALGAYLGFFMEDLFHYTSHQG